MLTLHGNGIYAQIISGHFTWEWLLCLSFKWSFYLGMACVPEFSVVILPENSTCVRVVGGHFNWEWHLCPSYKWSFYLGITLEPEI